MTITVDAHIVLHPPRQEFAGMLSRMIKARPDSFYFWAPWADKIHAPTDLRRYLWESARFNEGGQHFITFILYRGSLAGSVGLVRIDRRHSEGEIGYWLGPEFEGLGILTRSCRSFLHFAFHDLSLNRLEIRIPPFHTKSLTVARRLGFVHEGTLRQAFRCHGGFYDAELFSLLKKDFQ